MAAGRPDAEAVLRLLSRGRSETFARSRTRRKHGVDRLRSTDGRGVCVSIELIAVIVVGVTLLVFRAFTGGQRRERPDLQAEWVRRIDRWRDMDDIACYHRWQVEEGEAEDPLDDRTWDDLTMDLVFAEIDRTRSTVGQQRLYHRLRVRQTPDDLDRFTRLVDHFVDDPKARFAAQERLARLTHNDGYRLWVLCRPDAVVLPWWYYLFPVLTLAAVSCVVGYFVWPRTLLVLLGLAALNIALRVMMSWRVFQVLGAIRQVAPMLRAADSVLSDPIVAELLRPQEDLATLAPLARSARWASRDLDLKNEIAASSWEYLNVLFLVDANATLLTVRTLRQHGSALLRVMDHLGDVDAAISTASLRDSGQGWIVPTTGAAGSPTEIAEAAHPVIEDVAANSLTMTPGEGIIVTGSNMSGKSTFLRTMGVTVLTAQTLRCCRASAYRSPPLRVRSAIGRSDDLEGGRSYYLVEVDIVLGLVENARHGEPSLFLFDELFRGTNTIERLAAGEAVLRDLPCDAEGHPAHLVIAATHDGELVDMLAGRYTPWSFQETVAPDGLVFDFKIRPGRATTRSAIALLEIRGAPTDLVERARRTATRLDQSGDSDS